MGSGPVQPRRSRNTARWVKSPSGYAIQSTYVLNIEDKAELCSEVSRVLRPNSLFGIYDVMKIGAGELTFPFPWATTAASSAVANPAQYRAALERVGFTVIAERTGVTLRWRSLINCVPGLRRPVGHHRLGFTS